MGDEKPTVFLEPKSELYFKGMLLPQSLMYHDDHLVSSLMNEESDDTVFRRNTHSIIPYLDQYHVMSNVCLLFLLSLFIFSNNHDTIHRENRTDERDTDMPTEVDELQRKESRV